MAKSNILTEYYNGEGVLVTVYKARKPRQGEKTWRGASKYSAYNLGGKAITLRAAGLARGHG
jgi:hypothetical protein